MSDFKGFRDNVPASPEHNHDKLSGLLLQNLEEMKKIMDCVTREWRESTKGSKRCLLYMGSHLYDYYLLSESCLLQIARTIDRWAPVSLDWRTRLIKDMQRPLEDRRSAVLSEETSSMLMLYLTHFQNYNSQFSNTFANRVETLAGSIEFFHSQFEKEIIAFSKLFMR